MHTNKTIHKKHKGMAVYRRGGKGSGGRKEKKEEGKRGRGKKGKNRFNF